MARLKRGLYTVIIGNKNQHGVFKDKLPSDNTGFINLVAITAEDAIRKINASYDFEDGEYISEVELLGRET